MSQNRTVRLSVGKYNLTALTREMRSVPEIMAAGFSGLNTVTDPSTNKTSARQVDAVFAAPAVSSETCKRCEEVVAAHIPPPPLDRKKLAQVLSELPVERLLKLLALDMSGRMDEETARAIMG